MSTAATSSKDSANSPAAKNGKSGAAAKRNNGAHSRTLADCGQLADSLSKHRNKSPNWFTMFAQKTAHLAGRPITFLLAVVTIIAWGVTGPMFGYSDTWQLVINTGTTIITFLMVFLIQNSQNRDGAAMQAKLDELLRAVDKAREQFIGIEHLTDRQIEMIRAALERNAKNQEGKQKTADDSVDRLLNRLSE
jgi:low affinity Fe/Cu permease